ncbi:hypothetical protein [Paenibacillus sp. NPDC093718]
MKKMKAQLQPNEAIKKSPATAGPFFTEHDMNIENESDEVRLLG